MIEFGDQTVSEEELLEGLMSPKQYQFDVNHFLEAQVLAHGSTS